MFAVNLETMEITMHQGDTGSFKIGAARKSGTAWTEDDRALFTVRNQQGEIVMQRIYRLDDQWDLGDGVVLIEFHNADTDTWTPGTYTMERRYDVTPIWEGTPSTARCVDQLGPGTHATMVEGDTVRTVFNGTLIIDGVIGKI